MVTAGTITRRAVEPTWLTASNARVRVPAPLLLFFRSWDSGNGLQRAFSEEHEKGPKIQVRQDLVQMWLHSSTVTSASVFWAPGSWPDIDKV